MRIDTITIADIKKYAKLDHFGTLKRLVFPNYFAIVAFERKEGAGEVPAGLAVACEMDEKICIDWLFVRNNFRRQGVGVALIQRIFDLAVEMEKASVEFRIKKDAVPLGRINEVKEYLKLRSFEETTRRYYEFAIDFESFTDNPVISTEKKLKAKPLGILKPLEIRNALKDLMGEKAAMSLYDMQEYTPVFDAKLSSVLTFEDEACGLLLIKSTGKECYPVFIYAESPQETSALMVCSGLLASLNMPQEANIRFILEDKEIQGFLKDVFPNSRIEVEIMAADMTKYLEDDEDYDDEDDEDDDDFDFDDDEEDEDDEDEEDDEFNFEDD